MINYRPTNDTTVAHQALSGHVATTSPITQDHHVSTSFDTLLYVQEKRKERDEYILESLRNAYPLLRHMAYHYKQDYDDLYQEAAEIVLKSYERAIQTTNPRAYLHRAIRNGVLRYIGATRIDKRVQTLADHYFIKSLDVSLASDDPTFSLQDILSATTDTSLRSRDFSRLYAIISALPSIYREVLCMRFGLCDYSTHCPSDAARVLGILPDTERQRFRKAKDILRQHIELLDQVSSREKGVTA